MQSAAIIIQESLDLFAQSAEKGDPLGYSIWNVS